MTRGGGEEREIGVRREDVMKNEEEKDEVEFKTDE